MELPESDKQTSRGPTDATLIGNIHREPGSESQFEDSNDISSQGPRSKKPLAFHLSFIALLIMGFICALDATVLGVAIPSIVHELHGTTLEAFWASIAFLLAVVVVQPIYTSVSNVMGRMLPLYTSFFFFILGSIVFAVAQDMTVLIAGRVLEGLGAGGLDVLNEIILADITTLKERAMYLGYFSIPMLGGTVLGPILGGLFSQYATWRWIGWINLPLSAIGLVLCVFFLKLKSIDQPLRHKLRRLDWGGIALFTAGCTLFASPVAWAGAMFPWGSYETLVPLLLGAVLLAGFSWYESRPVEPVFPYRMFASRTACLTLLASFLHGIANYSITLYIPLFFQAIYLDAPLRAAVQILPLCFLAIGTAVIAAIAVEILRQYRLLILVSWIFMAVGAGVLTLLGPSSSSAAKESYQVILGMGIGPFWSVLNLPLQASMQNVDDMGIAAGILCSFRLFGGLIGLAVSSTIFNTIFEDRLGSLGPLPGDLAVLGDVRQAVGYIPMLKDAQVPADLLNGVIDVYKMSIFGVFWMISGVSVVGFLISIFIKEKSLEREELGRQRFQEKSRGPNQASGREE